MRNASRGEVDSTASNLEGEVLICHVEVDNVLSKGTLIVSNSGLREARLLREVDVPSYSQSGASGSGEGPGSSSLNLKELVSDILSHLFSGVEVSPSDVDLISSLGERYEILDSPGEIVSENKNLYDICRNEMGGNLKRVYLGGSEVVANELKSRLVALGARRMVGQGTGRTGFADAFLDFSTYLSGLVASGGGGLEVGGLVSGLGSEIFDALARGSSEVDSKHGATFQLPSGGGRVYEEEAEELALQVADLVEVSRVPSGQKRVGRIPVDVEESYDRRIKLMSCDVGRNGSELEGVTELGREASSYGLATLQKTIQNTAARLVSEVVKVMYEEELLNSGSSLCISDRIDLTDDGFDTIITHLREVGFEKIAENTVYVQNPSSFGILEKIS